MAIKDHEDITPESVLKQVISKHREQLAAAKLPTQATAHLSKKGKMKAAKAARKSKVAAKNAGQASQEMSKESEQKALAAAGMETLDPRAVECFVTGLSYNANEGHIQDHFAGVGPCRVHLLTDPGTKRSTGKAFLTFAKAELALKAVAMTGSKLQNRWIAVRLCQVRGDGPRLNYGPSDRPEGCLTVVVKCDTSCTEAELQKHFKECHVQSISMITDDSGEFSGKAFIDFNEEKDVEAAAAKHGSTTKDGHLIFVRYKSLKTEGTEGSGKGKGKGKDKGGKGKSKGKGKGKAKSEDKKRPSTIVPPEGKAMKFADDSEDEVVVVDDSDND